MTFWRQLSIATRLSIVLISAVLEILRPRYKDPCNRLRELKRRKRFSWVLLEQPCEEAANRQEVSSAEEMPEVEDKEMGGGNGSEWLLQWFIWKAQPLSSPAVLQRQRKPLKWLLRQFSAITWRPIAAESQWRHHRTNVYVVGFLTNKNHR